jgi:membrane protein implicated in regulation of membrane protease activity
VAVASFGSGALLNAWGWTAVQYAAVPSVLIAFVVLWRFVRRRPQRGAEDAVSSTPTQGI